MTGKSDGQKNLYAVVMAGGSGTRLWPLSRRDRPKQFLALQHHQATGPANTATLLQQAVQRALRLVGDPSRVLVLTQERYHSLAQQQLAELKGLEGWQESYGAQFPLENLILEPVGRNTAACLGLAARLIQEREPEAVMIALPADHLYRNEAPWITAMQRAIQFARLHPFLVTLGIPPRSASSRYGYLLLGEQLADPAAPVYRVQAYLEKPSPERARELIKNGALWNTGTFAWQVGVFLEELERSMPEIYTALAELSHQHLQEVYPRLPAISVDYGVMEKARQVAVVKSDFERLDLGALDSLMELWPEDAQGNRLNGEVICLDSGEYSTQGNLISSDQGLVAVIGVRDLIILRQGEVVLICPSQRLHEVTTLYDQLRKQGLEKYL